MTGVQTCALPISLLLVAHLVFPFPQITPTKLAVITKIEIKELPKQAIPNSQSVIARI